MHDKINIDKYSLYLSTHLEYQNNKLFGGHPPSICVSPLKRQKSTSATAEQVGFQVLDSEAKWSTGVEPMNP